MALRIFNTLTGKKEEFVPLQPGKVRMYVCGVTVYDYCHVGHARAAIVFDTVFRYLKHAGYGVTYVRNFTDIDDKIIKRAQEETLPWKQVTRKYIDAFYEDMDALNVERPTAEPLATDHIGDMIAMIEGLVNDGKAYAAGGDVYYAIKSFPDYGKLSGRNLEDMQAGARVEPGEHKHDPMDFALWKQSKPDEPAWDSPWGPGRPGWHIECSAMSYQLLGETFDLHGGGKDLVFPHHENEIAQSCGFTGKPPVRYWVHNGFVNINKEKMSKSLGNFFTIRDILKTFHPEVLRLFLLTNHYRGPIDFSDQYLKDAEKNLDRFYEFFAQAEARHGGLNGGAAKISDDALRRQPLMQKFEAAMDDDFNTAVVLADLMEELRRLNKQLGGDGTDWNAFDLDAATLRQAGQLLGLFCRTPEAYKTETRALKGGGQDLDVARIEQLIAERQAARSSKDFQRADQCRDELQKMGVVLKDSKTGTTWEVQ
ncbi:cysteine--tRNA ligase [Nitrospina watsonii]|uniref:Cysteine--tRNA ligase n=1 Tax=Nitrospina watsonii TaxID=1323948 RepID=A0ABM9HAT7_9BACT|nr:cysteine--tRNA ligase [Nitrospina watsonii]CAI2717235.1 Cysteine--tRNA ligase [Nitrospina watsonii]